MEINKDFLIIGIGYFLAIFFSLIGLIYGALLFVFKKDTEIYYDHSRNVMAIAVIFILLRLFASFGSLLFH